MKVEELPEDVELITNSQDIDYWLEGIKFDIDIEKYEIGSLLIQIKDDELINIWYCHETFPQIDSTAYNLYNIDQDDDIVYIDDIAEIEKYMPY